MESLLRLSGTLEFSPFHRGFGQREITNLPSGLLSEDDNGRTDLGTLEKRLADKNLSSQRASAAPGSNPTSPSQSTPNEGTGSTPHSALTSPEPPNRNHNSEKRNGTAEPEKSAEEVEALSDMMCSLVTNNCGETRYIGANHIEKKTRSALTYYRIFFRILYFLA
jgi:hypothetical protein